MSNISPTTGRRPLPLPISPRGFGGLRADDLAGPGLVFGAGVQVHDLHLHRLHLQVLGRHSAHFVPDLVSLHRDVLSLDAGTERK